MKLTKKQQKELRRILDHLERADTYVRDPGTAICRRSLPTTTLHYTRPGPGLGLYEVDKEIGSDLTGLEMGLSELRRFLEAN